MYPDTESVALIINKVTGDDVGTYKAVLHNDLGEASTEAKLVLSGAPQFTEPVARSARVSLSRISTTLRFTQITGGDMLTSPNIRIPPLTDC